jgi:hypothetical protein
MTSLTDQKPGLQRVDALQASPALDWILAHKSLLSLSGLAILNALIYGAGFIPIANLLELYQNHHLNLYTLPQGGAPGLGRVILAFLAAGALYGQGWRPRAGQPGRSSWAEAWLRR